MDGNQLVFGLDIGTRSVVGTVGYKKNAYDFNVVAHSVKMHDTRAMMDGQIHDIGRVAETIKEVKRNLEKQLEDVTLSEVCIAAAGRVLKTVTVKAEEVFPEEVLVNEETIRALELKGVESAYAEIKKQTKDEKVNYYCVAYTVIHYYLNDFQISNLADHKAYKISAEVLATFLPDEVIEGLYTAVDKAGLKVANLTLEPIAAIMVAIPENYRLLNIALVDVGAGTSDICITKDGSIIAYGMIPMAGDSLTEVISSNHLVDFKTAEDIKLQSMSKKKSIAYKDIMGLKQTLSPAEVKAELQPQVNTMTKLVADKIKELNGGKAVSAVFVVGGGGKVSGYTEALAQALGIAKERVALRGEEVMGSIHFSDSSIKKDPMLVTPVGICLNYYENKNSFIFVNLNKDSVKLYDNNRLTVIDAAIAAGYPNENLFPKRGAALNFTLNGAARMVRGELGEPASITVNGKPASANTPISPNDEIKIKKSTQGKAAEYEVNRLPEFKADIKFNVNGKTVTCPKFIKANNQLVSGFYSIKEGDRLEILDYYTLKQVMEFLDMPFKEGMHVNNEIATGDTKVYENFKVETDPKPSALEEPTVDEPVYTQEIKTPVASANRITIIVNKTPVVMEGKSEYRLVDVLDVYPFDMSVAHGRNVVMKINGVDSQFIDLIKDGDEIQLYWVE